MLLDSLRGELSPDEATRLSARLGASPELSAERDRLRSLLVREQAAQTYALADRLDPKAADRMASRILDRARRDEGRRNRAERDAEPGRYRLWARLLAVSVAVHVVALGVLTWRHFGAPNRRADERPNESIAYLPDDAPGVSPSDGMSDGPSERDPASMLPGDYRLDNEPIPAETLLADALPAPTSLELPAPDGAIASFPRGSVRAMWVRRSDSAKRRIESQVGSAGSLDRVKAGLAALTRAQADDGSFADAEGHPSVRATATVLLTFLSDGHSSRDGAHRATVERGIGWLFDRAGDAKTRSGDRALALFALSEDLILAGGSLTPTEARLRRASMLGLANSVRDDVRGGAAGGAASTDARWAELALVASSRAGILGSTTLAANVAIVDIGAIRAGDDVRTAMLDGTALLRDHKGQAFPAWNAVTAKTLSARLGSDGLVAGASTVAARAEETALILLALQVAYRTY